MTESLKIALKRISNLERSVFGKSLSTPTPPEEFLQSN